MSLAPGHEPNPAFDDPRFRRNGTSGGIDFMMNFDDRNWRLTGSAVGTVIDPDMHDELRVTVVATGLGSELEQVEEKPVQLVHRNRTGEVNYADLERPAVIRKRASGAPLPPPASADDLDYLDIAAFLRRQAD